MRAFALLFVAALLGCASSRSGRPAPSAAAVASVTAADIESSTPEREGMRSEELVELTRWLRDHRLPMFSLLISRHGRLVYELYTSSSEREDAHYVMSVTKTIVSALIGIAIDRHLIRGPDAKITGLLPRRLFASDADLARLEPLTLERIMGMAALDAPDPPRKTDPEAVARHQRFLLAPNRVAVALEQPLLTGTFQYNDFTAALAGGALQYSVGKSALEFAEENLFGPLGFRHYEWMHQDPAGLDNGGYGLRLRPIDMQKFGILYLNRGAWNGRQVISEEWVARSFTPWNRSSSEQQRPDYGWFWWTYDYGPGFTAHVADGWKGQRIAVFPEQDLVVTMTACLEDGSEHELFSQLIRNVVMPSVQRAHDRKASGAAEQLAELVEQVHRGPSRLDEFIEHRMVPSRQPKQVHRAFRVE